MAAPCYCCHSKNLDELKDKMNDLHLDAALQELGLLSTTTNSRLEYLEEKGKKQRPSNSQSRAPHSIPKMIPKHFKNEKHVKEACAEEFPISNSSASSDSLKFASDAPMSLAKSRTLYDYDVLLVTSYTRKAASSMKQGLKMYRNYSKPYDFPWRAKLEDSIKEVAATVSEDSPCPPVISRQDSGNKSNPSSPVKNQKSLTGAGCSIFRSRSLDDLDLTKLDLKSDCLIEAGRIEIDTVSQRINNLHVS